MKTQQKQFWTVGISIIFLFGLIFRKLLFCQEIYTHDSIYWYGIFSYYVDTISRGHFPFWDPYMLTGTYFYPYIQGFGLLDPLVLLSIFLIKVFGISILTAYTYFYLLRLIIFIIGAFFLFKHITDCRMSALISAGVLLFSMTVPSFGQNGGLNSVFLTPLALYFILLFFHNIKNNKKYLYLSCFLLITGITMNVYIPSYFIFNLSAFIIVIFILKIARLDELLKSFRDKKFLEFVLLCLFVILMMSAPLISLGWKDFSGEKGELFPSIRIIQKNGGLFKKMMATEIRESALSNKFANNLGVYSTCYNILNLIYPGLYRAGFRDGYFPKKRGEMSEMLQYIGIVPFLFCIIGLLYNKSPYRYLSLAMLLLISINMINFHFNIVGPPNFMQKFFNRAFPILKIIEVRQNFSPFFLLYMGMLLSMGLEKFLKPDPFGELVKIRYKRIIIICLLIFFAQFFVTIYIFPKAFLNFSVDLFTMLILVFVSICFYLYGRDFIWKKLFCVLVLFFMFADLAFYNYSLRRQVLHPNDLNYLSKLKCQGPKGDFEFFRRPFVRSDELWKRFDMGFGESVLKLKGAMSKGHNHHAFTTRRYYDFFTHVPLQNQFVLSGITYPIIRFYETDKIKWADKRAILQFFIQAKENKLEQYLFLENEQAEDTRKAEPINFSGLTQFQDAREVEATNIERLYSNFMMEKGEWLQKIKENLNRYLETPEYTLVVKEFSPNELKIAVENQKPGYLYYNDGWSQYWKAYDNNKEIPIYIANYNFKAVFLAKGKHHIRFVFDPIHYRFAVIIYHLGLLLSLFMILFNYVKLRQKEKTIYAAHYY